MGFLRFNSTGAFPGGPTHGVIYKKEGGTNSRIPFGGPPRSVRRPSLEREGGLEALRGKELIKVFAAGPLALQRA